MKKSIAIAELIWVIVKYVGSLLLLMYLVTGCADKNTRELRKYNREHAKGYDR